MTFSHHETASYYTLTIEQSENSSNYSEAIAAQCYAKI